MKEYRGVELWLHYFLILAPDRGEWSAKSAALPSCFFCEDQATPTSWIRGCLGPRGSVDTAKMKEMPYPARIESLFPQLSSQWLNRYTDYTISWLPLNVVT